MGKRAACEGALESSLKVLRSESLAERTKHAEAVMEEHLRVISLHRLCV